MYGFYSFYFVFLILYLIYGFLLNYIYREYKASKKHYLFLLFLPLLILSAFRGETVGGDLAKYLPYFGEICETKKFVEIFSLSSHEPGFIILNKLISYISKDTHFFIALTSLMSLVGPMVFLYKYSNNCLSSVLIYYTMGYYTNTFNNIRQSIAISIFFISICYLLKRKALCYYLLSFFAISFHYSALVLLFIYPLANNMMNIRKVLLILSGGVALYIIAGTSLVFYIVSLIFVKYNPDFILDDAGTGWNLLVFYFALFIMFLHIYEKNKNKVNEHKAILMSLILLFQLLALLFQLFATLYPSATRMGHYFFVPVVLLTPVFVKLLKPQFARLTFNVFFILFCLLSFYKVYSNSDGTNRTGSNGQGVIPYVFYDRVLF